MDLNFYEIFLIILASYLISLCIIKLGAKFFMNNQTIEYKTEKPGQDDYPPFYPNGWLPVLESICLKKNQIVPVFAIGNNLVVFRSTAGKVTVLDAYCPHLGAHLAYGGQVIDDTVKCPFHGWVYNQDGKCTHIPGINESNLPKVQIKVWDSLEIMGFILVWNQSNGEKPNWFPPQLESGLTYQGRLESRANCHIQEIPENIADVMHFNHVHKAIELMGIPKNRTKIYDKIVKLIYWDTEVIYWSKSQLENEAHIAYSKNKLTLKIFGVSLFTIITKWTFIGPALNLIKIESKIFKRICMYFVISLISTGPLSQRIVLHIYSCSSSILNILFAKFTAFFATTIQIQRDVLVWNNKKYLARPFYAKNEQTLKEFRRWFTQFYSDFKTIES